MSSSILAMARLLNAKDVISAREFFQGESNSIAGASFSEPQDGGFAFTRFCIWFAFVLN